MQDTNVACRHCGKMIPPEEFRPRAGKICRPCSKAYRQKWLIDNIEAEKYCPKCKTKLHKDNFAVRHRWCKECNAKYARKKLTSEEKIQRSQKTKEFNYQHRVYQDGNTISLLQADAEENAVRMKVFSVQKQIAEQQPRQHSSLKQQGNYWIWE